LQKLLQLFETNSENIQKLSPLTTDNSIFKLYSPLDLVCWCLLLLKLIDIDTIQQNDIYLRILKILFKIDDNSNEALKIRLFTEFFLILINNKNCIADYNNNFNIKYINENNTKNDVYNCVLTSIEIVKETFINSRIKSEKSFEGGLMIIIINKILFVLLKKNIESLEYLKNKIENIINDKSCSNNNNINKNKNKNTDYNNVNKTNINNIDLLNDSLNNNNNNAFVTNINNIDFLNDNLNDTPAIENKNNNNMYDINTSTNVHNNNNNNDNKNKNNNNNNVWTMFLDKLHLYNCITIDENIVIESENDNNINSNNYINNNINNNNNINDYLSLLIEEQLRLSSFFVLILNSSILFLQIVAK
jgi:hypothetical protein